MGKMNDKLKKVFGYGHEITYYVIRYTDKEATNKKIAGNVRRKGDSWFRTGDLIVVDECGYWYFKDRMGETFRCKGEQVKLLSIESCNGSKSCKNCLHDFNLQS